MAAKITHAGNIRYIYDDQDAYLGSVEECRGFFHASAANGKALGRKRSAHEALGLVRAEAARQQGAQ